MLRSLLGILAVAMLAPTVVADEIKGQYVEARTCDVYTGACFANADTDLTGKHAVMAWKIDRGSLDGVSLDGLSVVAVIVAKDTLGLKQYRTPKSVVLVDAKATKSQKQALIRMAQKQTGDLLNDIVAVRDTKMEFEMCECKGNVRSKIKAGDVTIETRCFDVDHERGCGNDCEFYPPLCKGVKAKSAMTVEHAFVGKDFNETWSDAERRGAYVGQFSIR